MGHEETTAGAGRIASTGGPPPDVRTRLEPPEILDRLRTLSKRGKLAGFQPGGGPDVLFSAAAFGKYFDYALDASAAEGGGQGTTLRFSLRLLRQIPLVFAAVLILTVWPGCWLTWRLLDLWFPNTLVTDWTYWWYLPLTVLPIPWMWRKAMRESRAAAEASAREVVAKIAKELGQAGKAGEPSAAA